MNRNIILTFFALFFFGCAHGAQKNTPSNIVVQPSTERQVLQQQSDDDLSDVVSEKIDNSDDVETVASEASDLELENRVVITDLCEPIDSRWAYPTRGEKKNIKSLIRKTCHAAGVSWQDCRFFSDIVAVRESAYRPWVRHKLSGDKSAALKSYLRNAPHYGWILQWGLKDRKREDVSKIVYTEHGDIQNPYYKDLERWTYGLGLGGINVANHLSRFDKTAPPEILCDIVINTMVQIDIARSAVHNYGAENTMEVQAIFAGRKYYDENGRARPLSCSNGCPKNISPKQKERAITGDRYIRKRCKARGIDCLRKPNFGSKLQLRKMTIPERYEAAEEIRGAELPSFRLSLSRS